MDELHEITWKARFIARLAELFVGNGLDAKAAIADAHAHSQDCYPHGKDADPVGEADALYRELKTDTGFGST